MTRNLTLLSVALLGALGSSAVRAADPPLEEIQVTATRWPESTFNVPVATNVLDREEIRAGTPQTVMELLRGHAGTYYQQTTPGQGVVIVRGLKGSEVLQVVDGFRLNNAIFRNAPNQYIGLVDSQMLEQLEVVRGPMSALYGSDAMGGVVHMLSAEPGFEGADWNATGTLRSIYGSADNSTLSRAEGAAGFDRFVVSGGGTYQSVNDRRIGGGETLPYTSYSQRSADLKFRGDVVEGHELMLSAQYSEQPKTPRYDELTPAYGQTNPTSAEFWFEPQKRELVQLRWRGTDANWLWDVAEAHVGRQVIVDDRRTRDFGSVNQDRERNKDTSWGVTFQAGKEIASSHQLTWGFDWYDDEVESSRTRTNLNTGVTTVRAPRFPDGSTMTQLGLYAMDDWRASERLDLIAGLRWSWVSTELPPDTTGVGVKVDADDLSGNLGLAYLVADGVKLVTNLGRGYRAPNVFDLGTFGDRPGNRFNIPNADLKPESVTTVDGGVKLDRAGITGELLGWYSKYDDKITSVLTGDVTDSGRLVVQNRNATSLDLWGIEAALNGPVAEGVRWYATATWTTGDETYEGDDYPADRIPPIFGTAGLVFDIRESLTFEAYLLYAGEQDRYSPRDEVDPRIKPGGTPGWVTWNARAAWVPSQRFNASLRIENLGDRRYREFGSGLDAPGVDVLGTVELNF